jgi:hypothetical protein
MVVVAVRGRHPKDNNGQTCAAMTGAGVPERGGGGGAPRMLHLQLVDVPETTGAACMA